MSNPRVLVIDDNETMRDGMAAVIKMMGTDVSVCSNGQDGCLAFERKHFDLVITDMKMCPMDGKEVLQRIRAMDPDACVIVVTAYATVEVAVEAMKLGALDFLTKPFTNALLKEKVRQALEVASLRKDNARLMAHNAALNSMGGHGANPANEAEDRLDCIYGADESMKRLFGQIRKVAPTDAAVFIGGESGTGKELVARAVHNLSGRSSKAFVAVHCASLAESLLESELFGHEKGAFTGAIQRKLGRFEMADGGTIFLDEIGEINASVQTKLLRVLQEKEIERLGGRSPISVNVRILSATNRDLKKEVEAGRFREDLYYRLMVVPLMVPPLRERSSDIGLLARHLVAKHAAGKNARVKGVTQAAIDLLSRYDWPGNVRELEHAIENALVFCDGEELDAVDFPSIRELVPYAGGKPSSAPLCQEDDELGGLPPEDVPLATALEDLERKMILRAYRKANGVRSETARLLGLRPTSIYYKLEKYGIVPAASDKAEKDS